MEHGPFLAELHAATFKRSRVIDTLSAAAERKKRLASTLCNLLDGAPKGQTMSTLPFPDLASLTHLGAARSLCLMIWNQYVWFDSATDQLK